MNELQRKVVEKLHEAGVGDGGECPSDESLIPVANEIITIVGTRSYYDDVGDFHRKFDLPNDRDTRPAALAKDVATFRAKFLLEELAEFFEATGFAVQAHSLRIMGKVLPDFPPQGQTDLEDAADALADLVYVAFGTAHMMGLPFDDIWAEVQRANMTKVRASSAQDMRSKRGHAFDVVKPEGFRPPNHAPAIDRKARLYLKGERGEFEG